MSKLLVSAAALCVAGMFALTPAQAAERSADGLRGAAQAGEWEVSDQRRYRRHYHRRYYGPRRYYGYRPYYYRPYYAYRPYYRPYYYRPAPFPFFPFFW